MGWTSYHATYYKNGTVDRKAECDAYFMEGLNRGHFLVIKSVMVGTVYYAAVQTLKKCAGKDDTGHYIYKDIPDEERKTWAAVFLTSVDKNDYCNFAYKDMDETVGPCYYDCPESILKLLSETDSEYALHWREECRKCAADKARKRKLTKLAENARIRFKSMYDTKACHKGEEVILEKDWRGKWRGYGYTWPLKMIPADYEIIA